MSKSKKTIKYLQTSLNREMYTSCINQIAKFDSKKKHKLNRPVSTALNDSTLCNDKLQAYTPWKAFINQLSQRHNNSYNTLIKQLNKIAKHEEDKIVCMQDYENIE